MLAAHLSPDAVRAFILLEAAGVTSSHFQTAVLNCVDTERRMAALTQRERLTLCMLVEGYTFPDICEALETSMSALHDAVLKPLCIHLYGLYFYDWHTLWQPLPKDWLKDETPPEYYGVSALAEPKRGRPRKHALVPDEIEREQLRVRNREKARKRRRKCKG